MIALARRRYGASPLHLLGHVVLFAVAVYAFSLALDPRFAHPVNFIVWFIGGALLHDLAFVPFYLGADIAARMGLREHPRRAMPVANHLRVPAVMAGTMFLVFLPLILERAPRTYLVDSGHDPPNYLLRWALITAGLFAASAVIYAVRRVVAVCRTR